MNAYELADTLQETEPYYSTDYKLFDNAAAMLRQQADRILELDVNLKAQIKLAYERQDRIAELEKSHIELEKGIVADLNQRQSAEPVAWMVDGVLFTSLGAALNISFDIEQPCIPLYTHPAKPIDKPDEDIAKVVYELNQKANTPQRWVTAMQIGAETIIQLRDELAILRKAQE